MRKSQKYKYLILFIFGVMVFWLGSQWTMAAAAGKARDKHEKEEISSHVSDDEGYHDEGSVHLSEEEITEFDIQIVKAERGFIGPTVELSGEIVVNPDRFAHVVPRVAGVVRKVNVGLGDRVRSGDVMAIIDSRELSDLKSGFLAAVERRDLTRTSFVRENRLWKQSISSERDFLAAKQRLAESEIAARSAEQKLHAL
jgi:cobalt-zinc-cadmium efflux system membrane fusion protein